MLSDSVTLPCATASAFHGHEDIRSFNAFLIVWRAVGWINVHAVFCQSCFEAGMESKCFSGCWSTSLRILKNVCEIDDLVFTRDCRAKKFVYCDNKSFKIDQYHALVSVECDGGSNAGRSARLPTKCLGYELYQQQVKSRYQSTSAWNWYRRCDAHSS
jgi:hypothetical protein